MTWQRKTLDSLFGALSALAVTMWLLSGWQVQLRPADREAHVIPASGQESSPVRALHGAHGVLDVAEDERDPNGEDDCDDLDAPEVQISRAAETMFGAGHSVDEGAVRRARSGAGSIRGPPRPADAAVSTNNPR